jgi:hypothetical protein
MLSEADPAELDLLDGQTIDSTSQIPLASSDNDEGKTKTAAAEPKKRERHASKVAFSALDTRRSDALSRFSANSLDFISAAGQNFVSVMNDPRDMPSALSAQAAAAVQVGLSVGLLLFEQLCTNRLNRIKDNRLEKCTYSYSELGCVENAAWRSAEQRHGSGLSAAWHSSCCSTTTGGSHRT